MLTLAKMIKRLEILLVLMLGVVLNGFAIGNGSATVSPTDANQFGAYSVSFETATTGGFVLALFGEQNNLRAGVDDITLTFDGVYSLPASISASNVTVNGIQAASVSVSGQDIIITVGANVPEGTVNVEISTSAKIRNPSSAGSYDIDITVSRGAAPGPLTTNPDYSITAPSSQISAASVIPAPSIADTTAAYTIAFRLGAGGRITSSSTITMDFPVGTTVPSGAISGISVNGSPTTGTGSGNTVVINSPSTIDNNELVTVEFALSAGLENPTSGTAYSIDINTSTETSVVASQNYSISDRTQLSFSAITLGDNSANATSSYNISFTSSNSGDLSSANPADEIVITFPAQTVIPGSIVASNITISAAGFTDNPSDVNVSGQDLILDVPFTIPAESEIEIDISSGAFIQNPAEAGNYSLSVLTREDDGTAIDPQVTSNPYAIGFPPTQVTTTQISASDNSTGATGVTYTFTFQTGGQGRLIGGTSDIFLGLPSGFGGSPSVTVNGQASTIGVSAGVATIDVPASVSIGSGGSVTLVVSNVTNPSTSGNYTFQVYTSVEPTQVPSQNVYIGNESFSIDTFSKTETDVNTASGYSFSFSGMVFDQGGGIFGGGGSRFVQFTFPEGTELPASMSLSDANFTYDVPGLASISYASNTIDQNARVLRVFFNISAGLFGGPELTDADFAVGLGIINPSVPASNYTVAVSNSEQALTVNSSTYSITSTTNSVTVNSVSATPALINSNPATYTVNFTTSANGKLVGGTAFGSSTINVDFGASTVVPAGPISSGAVTLNGMASGGVTVVTPGTGGEIQVTVPSGMEFDNSSIINLVIASTAGLQNTATLSSSVNVSTSSDATDDAASVNLSATAPFQVTSVALSPTAINASAAYTIRFTTSSSGALTTAANDSVRIEFPTNTDVPSFVDRSLILVNGDQLAVNAVGYSQTLAFAVPANIADATNVTVNINSGAGILNPSTPGSSYTLDVNTTQDTGGDTSPNYTITATSSTIGVANVAVDDITPSLGNRTYTITSTLGSNGRLEGGAGTITVRFPSGTTIGASVSATIEGDAASVSVSSQDVIITVPNDLSNNQSITITVDDLTNPVLGTYQVLLRSSSETTFVASNSYQINTNTPLTVNSAVLTDLVVNGPSQYTFNVTSDATAGNIPFGGTVTITFPSGTTFPVSVQTTDMTLNGSNPSSITVNALNRTIAATLSAGIPNGTTFDIIITSTANVLTPSEPGTYAYDMRSSSQPATASTSDFSISSAAGISTISFGTTSVAISPSTTATPVQWTWNFTTGPRGGMQAGVGRIFLDFDQSVFTNPTIPTTAVRVNGTNAKDVQRAGSLVTVTIPNTATINNNSSVTVVFTAGAGIQLDPNLAPSKLRKVPPSDLLPGGGFEVSSSNQYSVYTSTEPDPQTAESNPLPIELAEFKAETGRLGEVTIRWTTATELENYGFYIERTHIPALDAQKSPVDTSWSELGFVEGAGFSTTDINYEFRDNSARQSGTYLYRLKQVDFNGRFEHFGPVEVGVGIPESFELGINFPNPFNPSTVIPFQVSERGFVVIRVFDVQGRLISTLVDQEFEPGYYQHTFDGRMLSSGVYIVQMLAPEYSSVRKVMLVK